MTAWVFGPDQTSCMLTFLHFCMQVGSQILRDASYPQATVPTKDALDLWISKPKGSRQF